MFETIATISLTGFLAGFIFSMPVAGPISIIITSNALKGKLPFCNRLAIGSVIVEFVYVLIAVFGIASLYPYYKPLVPYLLLAGAILILSVGIKISRTKLDLSTIQSENIIRDKYANRGGFRIGLLLNLTNPTLFFGWLVSSFMVFSFLSSLGVDTGGLEQAINRNVEKVSEMAGEEFNNKPELDSLALKTTPEAESVPVFALSVLYAFNVAFGALIWFLLFARFVVKHRAKLNILLINRMIHILGFILSLFALYLGYESFRLW